MSWWGNLTSTGSQDNDVYSKATQLTLPTGSNKSSSKSDTQDVIKEASKSSGGSSVLGNVGKGLGVASAVGGLAAGAVNSYKSKKEMDKAYDKSNELLKQAGDLKGKDISELQAEGRSAAGQAASDKAGQAKRQAKAASMQSGGNRLAAANAAASAAQKASSEGFDTTANAMTSLAAQKDASDTAAKRQSLQQQASNEIGKAEAKQKRRQALIDAGTKTLSTIGSVLSDEDKKVTKHTYIPVDKRVRKGE